MYAAWASGSRSCPACRRAAARPRLQFSGEMADDTFSGRVTRQGEEALGRLAQELLENPLVSSALTRAFETRERAMRAQELAMSALNIPSAGDLERLTRRVRSVSQRLESIEDGLDRVEGRLARPAPEPRLEERLDKIEALLERLQAETGTSSARPSSARSTSGSAPARKRRSKPSTD
jgi:hypothetical protein